MGRVTINSVGSQLLRKTPSKETSNSVSDRFDIFPCSDKKLVPKQPFSPIKNLFSPVLDILKPIRFHFGSITFLFLYKVVFGCRYFVAHDHQRYPSNPLISSYRCSESFESTSEERDFLFLLALGVLLSSGPVTTREDLFALAFFFLFTVAAKAGLFPSPTCGLLWLYLQFLCILAKAISPCPIVARQFLRYRLQLFSFLDSAVSNPPFPLPPFL